MKSRYILFRRAGVYCTEDTVTRKQSSLRTKDEAEAMTLLNAKNESFRQPVLNMQIARAYLTASDPAMTERTWQTVMEQMQAHGKDATKTRYARAMKAKAFDGLRQKRLIETSAEDFLKVLNARQDLWLSRTLRPRSARTQQQSRAYARKAKVLIPAMEDYEKRTVVPLNAAAA